MEHLSEAAKQALDLDIESRINYIRKEHWIEYPNAKILLDRLEYLFNYPKCPKVRVPNLLIISDTNNGKTALASHFNSRFSTVLENDNSTNCPVLYMQAPPAADDARLFSDIMRKYSIPYNRISDYTENVKDHALSLMQKTQVKMLILDDFHHILTGSIKNQQTMLNAINYIGNELMIPVVCLGICDLLGSVQLAPQLLKKFDFAYLPRWKPNEEFLCLMASIERCLPLKNRSNLTDENLSWKILALTGGSFGEFYRMLIGLAVYGITSGKERIDLDDLEKIKWKSPYERADPRDIFM